MVYTHPAHEEGKSGGVGERMKEESRRTGRREVATSKHQKMELDTSAYTCM